MTKRYFYAENDFTVKNEYSSGAVNAKTAIAFESKKERDKWVQETKYLLAKTLTKRQAIKMNKNRFGESTIELYPKDIDGCPKNFLIFE